jgi:hypothetical protein
MAVVPTPSHLRAFERFIEAAGMEPFRRSYLSEQIYPLTNPRSRQRADEIAHALIQDGAKRGQLQRHGHLHWMRVTSGRTLKSGRSVPELHAEVVLTTTTRCPAKWASVDLETGDVWVADEMGRWKRPSQAALAEIKHAIGA